MAQTMDVNVLRRGEPGYEEARRAAVWNARTPERHPDAIVLAAEERDVIAAVRLAAAEGLRIGVRSGGHSWAGNHVRDGGLLLDLSAMRGFEIDAGAMRASVQPGCRGDQLLTALGAQDLFFPAGHCPGVGLGGYLLQGGYGWNGRVHGPACMSVEAIDVVTADGQLVHASERENPDLLWAARGAGPGFFGVVTRFHLRLQPRPAAIANGLYLYPIEELETVFTWAHEIAPRVPREVELMVVIHHGLDGEREIAVTGPALAADERTAREALAVLETCPALQRAKAAAPYAEVELADLYAVIQSSYPDHHRYATDNMWTHAPIADMLPGLRRIADTLPPAPSHMLWMNWGPGTQPAPERTSAAFSVEDDTYIACYAVWQDAAEDGANEAWATERMRELEPLASGIQLADENLARRPARFLSDASARRMRELRERHDPEARFHSWMTPADLQAPR
jgi:FAD/FMN-containing dehydrogenase